MQNALYCHHFSIHLYGRWIAFNDKTMIKTTRLNKYSSSLNLLNTIIQNMFNSPKNLRIHHWYSCTTSTKSTYPIHFVTKCNKMRNFPLTTMVNFATFHFWLGRIIRCLTHSMISESVQVGYHCKGEYAGFPTIWKLSIMI